MVFELLMLPTAVLLAILEVFGWWSYIFTGALLSGTLGLVHKSNKNNQSEYRLFSVIAVFVLAILFIVSNWILVGANKEIVNFWPQFIAILKGSVTGIAMYWTIGIVFAMGPLWYLHVRRRNEKIRDAIETFTQRASTGTDAVFNAQISRVTKEKVIAENLLKCTNNHADLSENEIQPSVESHHTQHELIEQKTKEYIFEIREAAVRYTSEEGMFGELRQLWHWHRSRSHTLRLEPVIASENKWYIMSLSLLYPFHTIDEFFGDLLLRFLRWFASLLVKIADIFTKLAKRGMPKDVYE